MQQVAGPEEVYAQPANLHVARFMGYRNVIELKAGKRDGNMVALEGLGLSLQGTVKQDPGSMAAVAIRPEDLSVGAGPNAITGRVENVEYGGHDSLVDVKTAQGALLHARTGVRVNVGDEVGLTISPDRVLVYPGEGSA